MREVAVATVILWLLLAAVGLPWAVALRRAADGWVAVLVDAALQGLVWLPVGVTAWAWIGWAGLTPVVLAWVTGIVLIVTGRASFPPVRAPGASGRRGPVLAGAWLLVLAVAGLVRLREVNFLPWIGDMGAYVNWANELVRTGELNATWPPLFPAYLSVSRALFGSEHTTIGIAAVGIILLLGVARLLHQLGAHASVVLAAGAAVALHLHAVWYSSFPTSESLNAPVFVLWLILVHRLAARSAPRRPLVVGVGLTMFALGMLRGSAGLLLVPLGVVVALALTLPSWRRLARPLWLAWAASAVGTIAYYWYGIAQIRKYFVSIQMREVLPARVWSHLNSAGYFDATVWTAFALCMGAVALLLAGSAVVAQVTSSGAATSTSVASPAEDASPAGDAGASARNGAGAALLVTALALAGLLVWQWASSGEVWAILRRMAPVLAGGAILAVAAARSRARSDQVVVLLMGLAALVFLGLHSGRLGSHRTHSFYLYWDRYLVSEVLPVALVLTFLVAGWAAERAVRALPALAGTGGRAVRLGAAGAALVLVVGPGLPALRTATSHTYLDGAYGFTKELADLAGDDAVYWSADGDGGVPGFTVFPNTWMAFAVPLERTFGANVLNVDRGIRRDFWPDDVLGAGGVQLAAACGGVTEFVLFDIAADGTFAGERVARPGVTVDVIGVVESHVPFITQPPGDRGWHAVHFHVTAWRVTVDPALRLATPPCWVDADGVGGRPMLAR